MIARKKKHTDVCVRVKERRNVCENVKLIGTRTDFRGEGITFAQNECLSYRKTHTSIRPK